MVDEPGSLQAIASPPPNFRAEQISRHVNAYYGFGGTLVDLVSERDQNFRLSSESGCCYVVKIANAAEPHIITEFQIEALLHIERTGCKVAVPCVIPSIGGAMSTILAGEKAEHVLRIVSYVPGRPLDATALDPATTRQLGNVVAEIGVALHDFQHPGDGQSLLWDMRRAGELRGLTSYIVDPELKTTICACLDAFEENAAPQLGCIRSQVIHNDLNPDNVLVAEEQRDSIVGVIDFGDLIRAPLIIDVAIAASYLRSDDEDATALLAPLVAGYNDVTRLTEIELELLYDLVRTRLATTITIMHWRSSTRAEGDAYTLKSLQSGNSAGRFLARVNSIPRDEFAARIRQHCAG